MQKLLVFSILGLSLMLSGCAQRCLDCSMSNAQIEKDLLAKSCPKGVETLLYLDQCNNCGFPVTQRSVNDCKGAN